VTDCGLSYLTRRNLFVGVNTMRKVGLRRSEIRLRTVVGVGLGDNGGY
jgi:hypothetical protein